MSLIIEHVRTVDLYTYKNIFESYKYQMDILPPLDAPYYNIHNKDRLDTLYYNIIHNKARLSWLPQHYSEVQQMFHSDTTVIPTSRQQDDSSSHISPVANTPTVEPIDIIHIARSKEREHPDNFYQRHPQQFQMDFSPKVKTQEQFDDSPLPSAVEPSHEQFDDSPSLSVVEPSQEQFYDSPSPSIVEPSQEQFDDSLSPSAVESTHTSPEMLLGDDPSIWVFGYGSLLWKTGFAYRSKHIGYVEGYARRFYQGNAVFRGEPGKLGRVANLVEEKNSKAWGVAFEIHGKEEVTRVLNSLNNREVTCGGYATMVTTFYPRNTTCSNIRVRESSSDSLSSLDSDEDDRRPGPPADGASMNPGTESSYRANKSNATKIEEGNGIQVLLYTATSDNDLYLGPDTIDAMARQVVSAKGTAGTNVEYVTKTADFVRQFIPEDEDDHLFQIDAKVRELVYSAQAHNSERVRLGLSDLHMSHGLQEFDLDLQASIVKAS